jgi:nitrate/nitrite transport system ATP-binding protein
MTLTRRSLSDRIVMMTNGPAATIGDICEVGLDRPPQTSADTQNMPVAASGAAIPL